MLAREHNLIHEQYLGSIHFQFVILQLLQYFYQWAVESIANVLSSSAIDDDQVPVKQKFALSILAVCSYKTNLHRLLKIIHKSRASKCDTLICCTYRRSLVFALFLFRFLFLIERQPQDIGMWFASR